MQGLLYDALLVVLSMPSGTIAENASLMRLAIVVLCGSVGGFLGMAGRERKHRR